MLLSRTWTESVDVRGVVQGSDFRRRRAGRWRSSIPHGGARAFRAVFASRIEHCVLSVGSASSGGREVSLIDVGLTLLLLRAVTTPIW